MRGCGCSFTPVENKETEEIKYTDALAEQFAAEVGVDPRPNETLVEIDERGAFIRQPNAFIQPFGDKEGGLKAEANRFGIYWATGCNWSNRPIIVRELLGLQDVISETRVSPSGETNRYGHAFGQYPDFKDPATGAYFLSEFYKRANPDFKGRATTPTLVDVKEKKAVNNDYHRLTNYLEVQFPTVVHESAASFDKIYISGGRVGTSITVNPDALLKVTRGQYADIIQHN